MFILLIAFCALSRLEYICFAPLVELFRLVIAFDVDITVCRVNRQLVCIEIDVAGGVARREYVQLLGVATQVNLTFAVAVDRHTLFRVDVTGGMSVSRQKELGCVLGRHVRDVGISVACHVKR